MLLRSLFYRENKAVDVNTKCEWKEVMIDTAGNKFLEIIPGNWVAVICESKWYVGQGLQLSKSNNTYLVKLMEITDRKNTKFKYRSSSYKPWINTKDISA